MAVENYPRSLVQAHRVARQLRDAALALTLEPSARRELRDHLREVRRLEQQGRRTLVYAVGYDYYIDVFDPVFRRLEQDDRVVVFFACRHDQPDLRALLEERYESPRCIDARLAPLVPVDAYVTADCYFTANPLRRGTRSIEMYHGTGTSIMLRALASLETFDAHLAPGPQFVAVLEQSVLPRSPRARIYRVGYPKTDVLVRAAASSLAARGERDGSVPKTILYAPHWSPHGSLARCGDALISALASLGANLIVKLHSYALTATYSRHRDETVSGRLERLRQRHPNLTIATEPSTQDLYRRADVLVTDAMSSVAAEYCLCQKPLIAFGLSADDPDLFHRQVVERDVERLALRFTSPEDARELAARVLDPDPEMEQRLAEQRERQIALAERHLYNPGAATEKAVEAILAELGLEAHAKRGP